MKTFIFTLVFSLATLMGFSQRLSSAVTVDTVETLYTETLSGVKAIQLVCTELGGTSDGVIRIQGSVDGTNWVNLTSVPGVYDFFPNDTLTITDGANLLFRVNDNNSIPFFRASVTGTASDTTRVAVIWKRGFLR